MPDLHLYQQLEDILSFVAMRVLAKKKKGMISQDDFDMLSSFGAMQAIQIVTVANKRKHLQEMMDEELRKTLELLSQRSCGGCRGRGIRLRAGARYKICRCVDMVHYRGDTALPIGEQFSNEYFTGEFSKNELGKSDTVKNILNAVMLFLMPR